MNSQEQPHSPGYADFRHKAKLRLVERYGGRRLRRKMPVPIPKRPRTFSSIRWCQPQAGVDDYFENGGGFHFHREMLPAAGRILSVEHLLVLQYLLRHPEIDTSTAASITQQNEREARETLSAMEVDLGYLERGGAGRGTYWTLRYDLHRRLSAPGHPDRDRRIDWEAAKTRVLSVLKQRVERGEQGLSNAEIRRITHLDRGQVKRLMMELCREGTALLQGKGRGSRWIYGQRAIRNGNNG